MKQEKSSLKNIKKKQNYQKEKLSKNTITLEEYTKEDGENIKEKKHRGDESDLKNALNLDGDTQSLLDLLHELILQSYKIEKEFKDFKVLIESVLEMIPQAVVVFNDNGTLFYQNKKASDLKGLSDVNMNDLNESEIKIGSSTYLLQSSHVSHKQIITATNITEQKRQERLANMGQVSAHLAHEIRNPIGSLSLLVGVLSKKVDEANLEIVDEMKKSIWRVERIIKSTLLFSKGVQAHKKLHSIESFKQSLQQVIKEYGYTKPINFKFEMLYSGDIFVDFSLYEIALHNILCNAIDAIEDGECDIGEVEVVFFVDSNVECGEESLITESSSAKKSNFMGELLVREVQKQDSTHHKPYTPLVDAKSDSNKHSTFIVCRIYDNGKDIQDINSLFEAFKTTKLKGHGLGLALSQQIAEAHSGMISANDKDGKFFEIRVPVV